MDDKTLRLPDVIQLLVATSAAADVDLADRRLRTLNNVAEMVSADAGHWAWGRGNPTTSTIAPLAIVDFGYTPDQRSAMIEQALGEESMRVFQRRAMPFLDEHNQLAVLREDVCPDDEWRGTPSLVAHVARLGLDAWMHTVRYSASDTWSVLHLMRLVGRPEFERQELDLAYGVLAGVCWLHVQPEESLPADTFVGLTPRQRTVMLLLLDGQSRKQIACSLGVSADTVDDHLKVIFRHFRVHSAMELAAIFLRNR